MRRIGKLVGTGALALAAMSVAVSPAQATRGALCQTWPIFCKVQPPSPAPEIDPNLVRGTVTILTGGVMILADRRRRRR